MDPVGDDFRLLVSLCGCSTNPGHNSSSKPVIRAYLNRYFHQYSFPYRHHNNYRNPDPFRHIDNYTDIHPFPHEEPS